MTKPMPSDAYWDEKGMERPPELWITCPYCKVRAFELCVPHGRPGAKMRTFHPSRTEKANEDR